MTQEQVEIAPKDTKTTADTKAPKAKPPVEAKKKSPLIAIIAIVVVIALIGTAFAVMMLNVAAEKPGLKVTITPTSISMPNGSQVRMYANVYFLNNTDLAITDPSARNLSDSVACAITVTWQAGEDDLGDIESGRKDTARYWQLNSMREGTSKINWSFKYRNPDTRIDFWLNKTIPVTITIAELDYISISPPSMLILKNKEQQFTAEAFLTNGILADATFAWDLDNDTIGAISDTTGATTNFTAGPVNATGNLTCTGTYSGKVASTNAPIEVITHLPQSETSTKIYDMFNVPLDMDMWKDRYAEKVLSATYPVSYVWLAASPKGADWIYTDFRMNVTAKNISKANTTENPVYLPVTNPDPRVRGGNIRIDWYSDYMNESTVVYRTTHWPFYGGQIPIWYDSWYYDLNGTVKMDKVAAKMILNMTDSDFRDFDTWKIQKFKTFTGIWSAWLLNEMNARYKILPAYEADGNALFEEYDISKIGEEIVITIKDYLSWGMESILGRWWLNTFLTGFEGWPEKTHFTADIGPLWSDFNLETVMQYGMAAKTSTRGNESCWVFESMLADAAAGTYSKLVDGVYYNYSSEMNPWAATPGYWNYLVANAFYGEVTAYDYTPNAWNLGPKDTLSIKWPSTSNIIGYKHAGSGVYNDTVTGHADPLWIEPVPGEVPSVLTINKVNRTIEFKGPFDANAWSETTNAAREIRENRTRIGGLLPRGVPYIEFIVNTATELSPIAALSIPPLFSTNSPTALISGSYDLDGSITDYYWDFDDGSGIAHTAAPTTSHSWTTEGYFNVTLRVVDNDGHQANDTAMIRVLANLPPTASFTFVNPIGNVQTVATMNASASSDADGSVVSYQWEFGDGSTNVSTTPVVTHQYTSMKNYKVNLTVVDNGSAVSNKISKTIGIQTDLCAKIVMPDVASVGQVVSLTGEKSFSFNGSRTVVNYTWDFGDGAMGYSKNVTHSWAVQGIYVVTLKVNDSAGDWSPNMTGRITIGANTVVALSVSLSRHSLFPGESATLTVTAVDGAGKKVSGAYTVDVSVNGTGSWTGLPNTGLLLIAGTASFAVSCADEDSYNITAIIQGDPSINGSEFATVANRTVEIRIYDFMQLTLGVDFGANLYKNYWNPAYRGIWGDDPFRYEAPAYHLFTSTANVLYSNVDTTYRMNVTARNITDISMVDPTFFPRWNTGSGGNFSFTWDYHYLNEDEFYLYNLQNKPPTPPKDYGFDVSWTWSPADQSFFFVDPPFTMYNQGSSAYDGWETLQDINITMDRDAAWQLINLPKATANVANWWAHSGSNNNNTVRNYWDNTFMVNEGGSGAKAGRLDIRSCDDTYSWQQGLFGSVSNGYYRLWDVGGGKVAMHIWRIGYGEDTLLARWLYWGGVTNGWNYPNGTPNGIVPFEPYYDDFHMSGSMDNKSADINLDAGVIYGFRAQKSQDPNVPADAAVWRWEQIRIDYAASLGGLNNNSEMDLWANNGMTFRVWDPAGTAWGIDILADQSPNVLSLEVGESLIMEKPRTVVSGIMQYPLAGDETQQGSREASGYYDWLSILEKWGNATIHPLGCYPGTSLIDKGTGDLVIVGPFWPIVQYYSEAGMTWLWKEAAPLIEYWIM